MMNNLKSILKSKCSKCGSIGVHACTGYPIVWTEKEKKLLKEALASIFFKEKK